MKISHAKVQAFLHLLEAYAHEKLSPLEGEILHIILGGEASDNQIKSAHASLKQPVPDGKQ